MTFSPDFNSGKAVIVDSFARFLVTGNLAINTHNFALIEGDATKWSVDTGATPFLRYNGEPDIIDLSLSLYAMVNNGSWRTLSVRLFRDDGAGNVPPDALTGTISIAGGYSPRYVGTSMSYYDTQPGQNPGYFVEISELTAPNFSQFFTVANVPSVVNIRAIKYETDIL